AGATSILNPNGTARVVIGGLSVVNGTSATPLTLQAGGTLADPLGTTAVAGGSIGGYQTFLSSDLPAYQAQLAGFAADLATALRTAPVASGGTLSLGGALQSLVTDLAASTSNVVGTARSQSSLLQSIQSAREGSQGVSIDEEMANMMEAQRAYQAAARVMTVV